LTDVEDDRIEVKVVRLQRSQITETLETVGTLLPVQATTVVAEVDGVIDYLPPSNRIIEYEEEGQQRSFPLSLDIGNRVNKGDVLVKLNPKDAEIALEQAQAQLNLVDKQLEDLLAWKREEEIAQLDAQVLRARSACDLAEADLRRSELLLPQAATSASEHESAVATARQERAALIEAEAALKLAKAGPTPQQIAVARAQLQAAQVEVKKRERELEKTTIRCPYPAVVTDRFVGVGDRVTAMPRVEIMQVADPRMLFAEVDVSERYLGRVDLDDVAEIRTAGSREPVRGKVELINGRIDPETRTFRVRIGIDNRTGKLQPGGFVRARIPIESGDNALVVPRKAVSFSGGQPAVFVFQADKSAADGQEGHVTRRPVAFGLMNREICEVTQGLRDGELLVLTNPAMLADQLPVRRKTTAPDAGPLSKVGWDSVPTVSGQSPKLQDAVPGQSPKLQDAGEDGATGEKLTRATGADSRLGEATR
jgi:RND family efflux transporter MFP subunit